MVIVYYAVLAADPVITIWNVTSTTAVIVWTQDFSDNIDRIFIIWTYSDGPCANAEYPDGSAFFSDGSIRMYSLDNLAPNSQYMVTVQNLNSAGYSSGSINISTSTASKCTL